MRGFAALLLALLATSAHAEDAIPAAPVPGPAPTTAPAPAPAADEETKLNPDDEFGPVLLIERIDITGNTNTQDEIIRRALPIAPGDILHASDKRLRNARFKVLALGYFRDVTLVMGKGSQRGNVIIEVNVVERGTFVLNRLWFGTTRASPYWFGTDVGDRNLLGLGISVGGGFIYAANGSIDGTRNQWAGEIRLGDGSLLGSRWGANGSLTFVHGSDFYRISGDSDDINTDHFRGFPYSRFGGRFGATYDITALSRLSLAARIEGISADVPTTPTQLLPDGRTANVDLHLEPGDSRVITAGLGIDRDTRSDPILPHSGGRITAAVEVGTSALGSDYDFATVFARYEHWWPLRDERHTIGIRLAGGVVIGNAPRFDRIYIADVNRMLTPRALGLVLSNAAALDILSTSADKPAYGDLGGSAGVEYAARMFRGSGRRRVYGGDFFVGAGVWGLAESQDVQLRDASVWNSLPIDLYIDAGVRIDTDFGIFELTGANALGRLRGERSRSRRSCLSPCRHSRTTTSPKRSACVSSSAAIS
ncbi:MAG TPA: BamA/TamA family outer membrane protein [Kofleriaceae bacterium]|nr:BamA/TamA family outer membrane protein [Kofleriaceae bacterium]